MTKPGYGTELNPLSFDDFVSGWIIKPGHTVWLRGGTYSGDITLNLNGEADNLILVKAYPGETPILDGKLTVNGSYCRFQNIVIRYSGWLTRNGPTGLPNKQFDINAPGIEFVNCVIHDVESSGFWTTATDAKFYGNVVYNIGWYDGSKGRAHSLYTQNATGRKLIKHNIMFNSFGWGIHAYTESGAIDNFDIIENTLFNAGAACGKAYDNILIGGGVSATGIVMNGNMTYGGRNGYLDFGTNGVTMEASNNYFPEGWDIDYTTFTVNENNTVGTVGNTSFLYANEYDANRANLTIYNEAQADSVTVDVSAVYDPGDVLTVRNVQDYWEDTQELTVSEAGTIAVDMRASERTVSAPVGWDAPATTFPTFGCFVVERA